MKTNVKGNNKGFSLVELIVVIAIMGILAVTLAPRLSQYVEKARVASDREAVNTIFTAAKLANVEYPIGTEQTLALGGTDATTVFTYDATGREWTLNTITADPNTTTDTISLEFYQTMTATLGKFNLKSNAVALDDTTSDVLTQITLATDASGNLSVTLDYDGDGTMEGSDYKVEE